MDNDDPHSDPRIVRHGPFAFPWTPWHEVEHLNWRDFPILSLPRFTYDEIYYWYFCLDCWVTWKGPKRKGHNQCFACGRFTKRGSAY